MGRVFDNIGHIVRFFNESAWARRYGDPDVSDFAFGNPQEMPLPGFVEALGKWSVPQNKDWYAYKTSEPAAQALVAAGLRKRLGLPFEDADIALTNGAIAALAVAICTLVDPGDEVIFISPPWFFYEALILAYDGRP